MTNFPTLDVTSIFDFAGVDAETALYGPPMENSRVEYSHALKERVFFEDIRVT